MNEIKEIILNSIKKTKDFFEKIDEDLQINVTLPHSKIDAHYCTNILFSLRKNAKPGYEEAIKKELQKHEEISEIEIIGGYINLKMSNTFFERLIKKLYKNELKVDIGHGEKINVEYCSVNPTGFLHIGHARNAIIGDAIASILEHTGFDVTKEYYINDAGNQVKILAESIYARYCEQNNKEYPFPEGGYVGEEIRELAKIVGIEVIKNAPEIDQEVEIKTDESRENLIKEIGQFAVNYFLEEIKKDLKAIGIEHTHWASEKEIIESGYIEKAIEKLTKMGLIYEGTREEKKAIKGKETNEDLLLLKTTAYGDDVDRPLKKSDGSWTYLAPDIGYHLNKIERGFKNLICVLGADHDSYAKRLKIAVKTLEKDIKHETPLCQMVSFEQEGKIFKFSKRKGNSLRVAEFITEIDPDILRFTMLSKKPSTQLTFDYEQALEVSMHNPVFYVQYAYARGCSVLRNYSSNGFCEPADFLKEIEKLENTQTFTQKEFQNLAIVLSIWKKELIDSVKDLAPHLLINYTMKLAEAFHALWQAGKIDPKKRFIIEDDCETKIRICLIKVFLKILNFILSILHISTPEKLESTKLENHE